MWPQPWGAPVRWPLPSPSCASALPQRCRFLLPAGAVWDLVRREDRPQLRKFFQDYLDGELHPRNYAL